MNRFAKGAVSAVAGAAFCASSAWAAIYDIGTLTDGTASRVLGMSQDGQYVAGRALDASGNQQPVIWSLSSGLIQLPNPAGGSSEARGIDVWGARNEIFVAGSVGNVLRYYQAPLNDLGSGMWFGAPAISNAAAGQFNIARVDSSDRAITMGRRTDINRGYRVRLDTALNLGTADYATTTNTPSGSSVTINSVTPNAGGQGVGYDNGNGGQRRAILANVANGTAQTIIPGGNGLRSEANGVSADGQVIVGQDYENLASTINQAFLWRVGDPSMTLLGKLPGDTQSWAFAVNDAGIAGGFSWNPSDTERAVIWDTTGIWDNSGQPMLLQTLLNNAGIDTSAWSRLSRITSISNDGLTVAGWGVLVNGQERGFVATIPEPATLALLAAGGLLLTPRRR